MKNTLCTIGVVALLLLNSQKMMSQDVAMNPSQDFQTSNTKTQIIPVVTVKENAVLTEGEYTFDNGKKKVLVVIKDGYYEERYSKNEFIKAKMIWVTKDEYNLVISEIKSDNLPFSVGTKMSTKIIKIKGNKYYYESNLKHLTWTGKFKKIN